MDAIDRIAWEVLNATADDAEDLEHIYSAVVGHCDGGSIRLRDIAERVVALVETGHLTARDEDSGEFLSDFGDAAYVWRSWFSMSPKGRDAWQRAVPTELTRE